MTPYILRKLMAVASVEEFQAQIASLQADLAEKDKRIDLLDSRLFLEAGYSAVTRRIVQGLFASNFDFDTQVHEAIRTVLAGLGYTRGYLFRLDQVDGMKAMVGRERDHVIPRWEDVREFLDLRDVPEAEAAAIHQKFDRLAHEAESDNRDAHKVFGDWAFPYESRHVELFALQARQRLQEALSSSRPRLRAPARRIAKRFEEARRQGGFKLNWNKFSSPAEKALIEKLEPETIALIEEGHGVALENGWIGTVPSEVLRKGVIPSVRLVKDMFDNGHPYRVMLSEMNPEDVYDLFHELDVQMRQSLASGQANRLLSQIAVSLMALTVSDAVDSVDKLLGHRHLPSLSDILSAMAHDSLSMETRQTAFPVIINAIGGFNRAAHPHGITLFPQMSDWKEHTRLFAALRQVTSLSIRAARARRPMVVTHMDDPEHPIRRDAALVFRAGEIVYLPIIDRRTDEVRMILALDKPFMARPTERRTFYPEMIDTLTDISGILEVLYRAAQERMDKEDMNKLLLKFIEKKDPYTRRHAEQVAIVSAMIAQQIVADKMTFIHHGKTITLTADDISTIRKAALLHDVGKIGVSSEVLQAPHGLAGAQLKEMRTHPVVGLVIIRVVDPEGKMEGAVFHHIFWNGDGYPSEIPEYVPFYLRKPGEKTKIKLIPLRRDVITYTAEIAAIADAYHAMSGGRSYTSAKGFPTLYKWHEIVVGAGNQFNPVLILPFLRSLLANVSKKPIGMSEGDHPEPIYRIIGPQNDTVSESTLAKLRLIEEGYRHLIREGRFDEVVEAYCWTRKDGQWVTDPAYKAPVVREFLESYFGSLFDENAKVPEGPVDWSRRLEAAKGHINNLKNIQLIVDVFEGISHQIQSASNSIDQWLESQMPSGIAQKLAQTAAAILKTEFIRKRDVQFLSRVLKAVAESDGGQGIIALRKSRERLVGFLQELAMSGEFDSLMKEIREADILFLTMARETVKDTFTNETVDPFLNLFN